MALADGSRMIAPLTRTIHVRLAGQDEREAQRITFTGARQQVRFR
jgi:hypothetical protein